MSENEEAVNRIRASQQTNMDYINNSSFMLARLDTSPLLKKIRKDIGGKVVVLMQTKEGQYYEEEEQIGKPLANEEGVMHICNMIEEIVNPMVVQGNLKGEHYWGFVARAREEVTDAIVFNCVDWGINDKDIDYIINKLLRILELFLTRPMDNKERESYQKEFQSKEVIQSQPDKNPLFNLGGGRR